MKQPEFETDLDYQGKPNGGCLKFAILIICLLAVAIANAQTVPKPLSVMLYAPQVDRILFGIDSVTGIIIRSDMIKIDRNYSSDKLIEIREYLLRLFMEQNKVKQDTVKTKAK